jgi:hypothetical protein
MPIVRIVEVSLYQVIDMIAVRHSLMAALGSMHVPFRMSGAFMPHRAVFRINRRDFYGMLIIVTIVRAVQMALVQIANVIVMNYARVAAFRPVWMSMIFMLWQVTISHCHSLISE